MSPDSKAKPTKLSAATPRRRRYKSKRHATANSDDENDAMHENTTAELKDLTQTQMKHHLMDSTNHTQSQFVTSTPTKGADNSVIATKECFRSVELPSCCVDAKTLQENVKTAPNVCHPSPNVHNNASDLQDNIYESIKNIKLKQRSDVVCRECTSHQCSVEPATTATGPAAKLSARKVLRKSRSRRHRTAGQSGCHERRRSLSVGNENCWRNVKEGSGGSGGGAEDFKNHFKKDDLFDIIRESMEKNRLCFQSNG